MRFLLVLTLLASALALSPKSAMAVSGSCSPNGANTVDAGVVYTCAGGTWTVGTIRVGATNASCASGLAGTIRLNGTALEFCNGTNWTAASGGTSQWITTGSNIYYNTGNVGIGTASPGQKLTVASSGAIQLDGTTLGWGLLFSNNGVTKGNITQAFAAGEWAPGAVAGDLVLRTNGGNILLTTDTGATTQLYLKNGGNVGIGTTTPASNLDIYGASSPQLRLYDGTRDFRFNAAYGGTTPGVQVVTNHPLGFFTNNIERARISADGNVGIGVTNPDAKLDVRTSGAPGTDGILLMNAADNHHLRIRPSMSAGANNGLVQAGDTGIIFSNGSEGTGAFVIAPWAGTPSGLRMDASGRVGIGTAMPGQMLSVAGTIESTSGGIKFPDGTTQTTAASGSGGKFVQMAYAETASVVSGSAAIPWDDTIPQITEGTEFLTVTISPTSASNYLVVELNTFMSETSNHSDLVIAALFRDSTANAIAATTADVSYNNTAIGSANNYSETPLVLRKRVLAGSTNATTFRFRGGCNGGAAQINAFGGSRYLGGSMVTTLTVTEIAP